jgi:hypothetical protein
MLRASGIREEGNNQTADSGKIRDQGANLYKNQGAESWYLPILPPTPPS